MARAVWSFDGLDELSDAIEVVRKEAPDFILKNVNSAGNKFRRDVIGETERLVNKRKGNLLGGYKKKTVVGGTLGHPTFEAQVSGGNKKAAHFHLIEHGHNRPVENFFYKKGYGAGRCHSSTGFTRGYHMMENTISNWESSGKMLKYGEKAVRQALRKGAVKFD